MPAANQPRMATLGSLLPGEPLAPDVAALRVVALKLNSGEIDPAPMEGAVQGAGDVFVAVPGTRVDGRDFIAQAVAAGAVAVLAEASDGAEIGAVAPPSSTAIKAVPVIQVPGLRDQLSAISARFYADPSAHLTVTGITGTNGKTTCSQLLAQLFHLLGETAGVMGTLGWGPVTATGEELVATGLTTADAIHTQQILAALRSRGVQRVAMEVSSHSLVQQRVAAVHFDTAIFTNLSRDHLDYHGTMEDYRAAKAQLFAQPGLRRAIINRDDPAGLAISRNLPVGIDCYLYAVADRQADIHTVSCTLSAQGIEAHIVSPWGEGVLSSQLLGEFNLGNLLAVVAAACAQGFTLPQVLAAVPRLTAVPGRMQLVDPHQRPMVVVDYAHTPDALHQALVALRSHCVGALWCVFGCGGDRDRGKRAQMGAIADELADRVVITSDNPRGEKPQRIIDDILEGIRSGNAQVMADRREAIRYAILTAQPGDMVLIAGKGHETYQWVGENRWPFSDMAEARLALRARVSL